MDNEPSEYYTVNDNGSLQSYDQSSMQNGTYEEEKIERSNNTVGQTRIGDFDKSSIDQGNSNYDQPSIEDDFGFGANVPVKDYTQQNNDNIQFADSGIIRGQQNQFQQLQSAESYQNYATGSQESGSAIRLDSQEGDSQGRDSDVKLINKNPPIHVDDQHDNRDELI